MARKKQEEKEPPGIVVLYTSLMILLLAFFILLNSMSKVEEARVQAVFQSLIGTFGFSPEGASPLDSRVFDVSRSASAPMNPVDQDYLALRGLVSRDKLDDRVRLMRAGEIKTVELPAALLFEPDTFELTPQGLAFVDQLAGIIRDREYPLSVRGHTDDAPSQRPGMDNWAISGRRAVAVVERLVARGVDASRLAAFGMAGYVPLAANNTPQHRLMNNRVELVFDSRDASPHQVPETPGAHGYQFRGFSFDLMSPQPGKGE